MPEPIDDQPRATPPTPKGWSSSCPGEPGQPCRRNQADDVVPGKIALLPGLPSRKLQLAPGPAHGVLANRPAEQRCQGAPDPSRVGACQIGAGDRPFGLHRQALVGRQHLAAPLRRLAIAVGHPSSITDTVNGPNVPSNWRSRGHCDARLPRRCGHTGLAPSPTSAVWFLNGTDYQWLGRHFRLRHHSSGGFRGRAASPGRPAAG